MSEPLTLDDMLDVYLEYAHDLTINTKRKYIGHLRCLQRVLGEEISSIDRIDTETFVKFRKAAQKRDLSPFTTESVINDVLTLLRYAHVTDRLERVPHAGRRLKRIICVKKIPTLAQLGSIYSYTDAADWPTHTGVPPKVWWQLFLCVLYFTGLRITDVLRLRWENCFENKIVIQARKTGKIQTIPLHPIIQKHLQAFRTSFGDWVFPVGVGTVSRIRKQLGRICDAANVRYVTPQQIRRLAGTEFERAAPDAGKKLLGHCPSSVSDFYLVPLCLEVAVTRLRYPRQFEEGPSMEIEPVPYTPEVDEVILPPNVDEWVFDGVRFSFRDRWFLLPDSGESLRVLRLLATSGKSVSWEEISFVADLDPTRKDEKLLKNRANASVCRLRKIIRGLFGLNDWNPIVCTGKRTELSWSLSFPRDFVPPRLGAPASVDIAEASCLSPTQLRKARLRAGFTQRELGNLVGKSHRLICYWERAEQPIFREAADKLHEVLGSFLDE